MRKFVALIVPGTEGGGHTWPGASLDIGQLIPTFGETTQEISANDLMWAFFQTYSLGKKPAPTATVVAQPTAAPTATATVGALAAPSIGGGAEDASSRSAPPWVIAALAGVGALVLGQRGLVRAEALGEMERLLRPRLSLPATQTPNGRGCFAHCGRR